jgi:hypothetical protein
VTEPLMFRVVYQYIAVTKLPRVKGRKTDVWDVANRQSDVKLGEVRWYAQWRQYCYFPSIRAVYSKGCLTDIADFIQRAMRERKGG